MTELPVIVNPVAGAVAAGRRASAWSGPRRRAGCASGGGRPSAPGHATELAARAARDRLPMLAAWGGDGTYNEVARACSTATRRCSRCPGGTTSVLAYELGVPRDPVAGARRPRSTASAATMAVAAPTAARVFLLMLSVGPTRVILERLPPVAQAARRQGRHRRPGGRRVRARRPAALRGGDRRRPARRLVVHRRQRAAATAGRGPGTPGADPFVPGSRGRSP